MHQSGHGPRAPPKCQRLRHPGLGAGRTLDSDTHHPPSGQGQVGGRGKGREGSWGRGGIPGKLHNSGGHQEEKARYTALWTVDPRVQEKPGVGQEALHRRCRVTGVWTELTQARRGRVPPGEAGGGAERAAGRGGA